MRIRVLLFGQLKDIVGQQEQSLDLQPGSDLASVVTHYAETFPRFKPLLRTIACSINQEYATASSVLREGDEVGLLPPVSGGKSPVVSPPPGLDLQSEHCAIVREKIAVQEIADSIKHPEDGATAVFEGIVRNHTRGRRTLYLDYEAYKSMALNEMEKLAQSALENFKVRDVRIVHRLGRLEIGETSVLIAVASAHRGPAFDACRWLIDSLKKTVPIWKKEHFEDGAVWADGEPFPEEIRAQADFEAPDASK
ncbi:MAG TPA: molybdenum cofactor biosynthesis protein MoaE [Candidatus Angelobacter sp.]|jgi:molybdopterin synthase catalytic subunit|nr:molybdenum cofactor biosynthesis protein MoaE [Candidatus Angelobacter sp.]